ncbi:MAG: hypothetical protein HOV81_24385, partial [Kofleriaceae bacterium]|nr:hypothetical protein [Kofleriaceae bacterium]
GAIPQSETPKSRDVATIAKDHPALQQLGSLPPEVMFGTQQHNRAQHAVQLLPEHDYAEFTSIVSSTPDPVAKGFLYKAIAAGNSVSEVRWLAAEMAGKDRGWLIDHLTLGDPRGVGGGVKQQWSTSCNAAMTLSLRGNYDPVFALRLRNRNMKVGEAHESDPNALNMNQADLEKQMLESAYGGSHPGSPAKHQGVANARDTHGVGRYADDLLNAQSGVTGMTFRSVDGPAGADVVVILDRSLDAGMQVPLVIGDNMNEQAHYVLVQGKRGAAGTTEYNIHDPWTGDTIWVSANDIANGTIPGRYHKVGTVEVPSALGNHEVATTTSQPAFAARGSAPSGARTATSESAVVSRESFFASGEQHAQEIEARVSGDVKQVVADTTRLALDSEWQVEAGLQVADPLFGETASNAFKTAASAHQKGSTEAQTLAKLTKQSRAMQGQMLDLFRDTKLSDGQRRHQLHRVINEWQHSLTQNRALFGGEFSNAFRFAEARRAVDASIGAGFSNKLVLDSNGALHKGKKSLGTFRELVDRVVATNRAFIEVGEPRELIIAISETAAGTREVLVLSRTRSSAPVPPPTSPTPVEVQNHPDSAAVIVDIGSGESSFAVDMVQASDRNGGPIVQTEYGPSAFDGSRTRRDLTWERAMPARSVDSVAVFGDPLQTIDVLFGKHGVKLVFINNVNAHYNAEQYRGLARALCKAMANGGRVEMQWTYSPETVGGPKGKRGHVQGRHVDDEVENTGDLETALQSEAPKFGRTITVRMAAPIKDQAYSREPSRRRDGADPSKDNITSPVPEHRSIITFD